MQYRIIGDTMPAVEGLFDAPGESMYTQSGGMAWMTEGITMDSNMRGGLGKSIGRMFSGESMFMATYKAERPGAMVAVHSCRRGASRGCGRKRRTDLSERRISLRAGDSALECDTD